ncbi:MAG TPA: T9SS type A sorting domain-containing protein [Chitinivibrionales bacterium]|nr:T9SS type A sorting domain-containing protein [Chitinivibrionales bacterium]
MKASRLFFVSFSVISLLASLSIAEIPAGYAGTPFPPGSAPRELMGRINFNDFDCGAENVSWYADDAWDGAVNRNKVGLTTGPASFCTNDNTSDRDTFYAAGVVWPNGVRYPDPVDTSVQDCYIGASHGNSFTKWTVHVSTAGKYWISSIWSAMEEPAHYTVLFLNGKDTVKTPLITFQQEASYHAWRLYSDFASVQLDTGVQVLYFQNGSNHLNQDFLFFATDSGKFTTDVMQPALKPAKTESHAVSISQNIVRLVLKDAGMTKVSVYDCLGREIATVLNKNLAAGDHTVTLAKAGLKQGVYFLHVNHNSATSVTRFQTISK